MQLRPVFTLPQTLIFAVVVVFLFGNVTEAQSQKKKKQDKSATIQGVIKNDVRKDFQVSYDEIKTSLRKVVMPAAPPFPNGWEKMAEADRRSWLTKFYESERGKKFLSEQQKLINEAPTFDVKYNDDGDFVVYDVPPGDYGLQGRIDKDVDGITYGFEVFARIRVLDDVDQIKLEPIPVTITPMFQPGQAAPVFEVLSSRGDKLNFDLEAYKDHYIFLNFMNTSDQTPGYQNQVQEMYKELGKSHKIKLLSIVLDEDKTKAIKWLLENKFTSGSYGFTEGWDHKTVEAYGVRSTPSGWIISNDQERKIVMSQHEFFRLARVKSSVTSIVRDRLEGKDTPTLASPDKAVEGAPKEDEDDQQGEAE